MRRDIKIDRKNYAMLRMIAAISRAIDAEVPAEKDRAARWAAAWGALSGIRSPGVRLRRTVLTGGKRR